MILRLEHVAISVIDIEQSLRFYREILGLRLIRRITPRDDGALGAITGMPGARAHIAHLALGDGMIELFQYLAPVGHRSTDRRQADLGIAHFCLASSDVRGDYARLMGMGMAFIGQPIEFRPGVWVVYGTGPDGEVIELREAA